MDLVIVVTLVAFIYSFIVIIIIKSLFIYLLNINIYLKNTLFIIFIYVKVNYLLSPHKLKYWLTDWLIDWYANSGFIYLFISH